MKVANCFAILIVFNRKGASPKFQVSLDVCEVISDLLEAAISMKDVLSSATTISGEQFVTISLIEEKGLLFVVNLDMATQVGLHLALSYS